MNLYDIPMLMEGEAFDTLLSHKNVRIMRIASSENIEENLYVQDDDEWVVVIDGAATVEMDGTTHRLSKGESLFIPARTPHSVLSVVQGTIWLAVHIG